MRYLLRFSSWTPTQRQRLRRLAEVLAIVAISVQVIAKGHTCQDVNIFALNSNICSSYSSSAETCEVSFSNILKLNTFKQDACLRFSANKSLVSHLKIRWKGLALYCTHETLSYTRDIQIHVLDSKRCPHMGSCNCEKCAAINPTDLVPELQKANSYPGRTGCLESCGGLGCDCLYPSSGCLFYRVYAVPLSGDIFEISRCIRWKQEVKLEVTIETNGKTHRYVLAVIPNVPIFMHNFTLTMTSLAVPPHPTLNQKFIINDKEYAVWQLDTNPLLSCKSRSDAKHLKCDFSDDCRCGPAESKVRCDCTYPQVSKIFKALSQKLPRQLGSTSFFKNNDSQIVARIRDTASTEFVITFQGKVNRTPQQVNKASAQLRIQF
ncbi:hypothetical protein RB195_018931 [Necator americanus]|uniref:Phlebovirus glycoprotein G2 fusion domain-containing protein n=1 Tax=Necator americanus TaxID=51031 RepID=A0ABR1CDP1_NECAM